MQPKFTPKRAAVYIRVSTTGQEDGSSLESQRAACQRLADDHGYSVVAVYRDVESGASIERKQFNAMLAAVQASELDAVICLTPDRLSRDMRHQAYALTVAQRAGVEVLFVQSPPADTLEGRILEVIKGVVAEVERVDITKRTQSGMRARVAEGHYLPGYRAPYGYQFADPEPSAMATVSGQKQRSKTRLKIDPVSGPVVQRIFAYVAAGQSVNSLEQVLTDDRVPTPTEHAAGLSLGLKRWSRATLRELLRNPVYRGEAQAFRWKVKYPHLAKVQVPLDPITEPIPLKGVAEAIVTPELWQAANDQLDRNRRELSSRKGGHNIEDTLLRTGYARCGYCGGPLVVDRGRSNGNNISYRCPKPNADHGGHRVQITTHILDTAVWGKVMDVLTDPQYVKQYMQQWLEGGDTTATELAHVVAELAGIATKERRLAGQLGALDDPAPVVAMLNDLSSRKRMLLLQQNNLAMRETMYRSTLERWETMLARWKWQGFADHPKLQNMGYADQRMWLANLNVQAEVWQGEGGPDGQRYRITMAIDESFWLPSDDELTGASDDPASEEAQHPRIFRTSTGVPVSGIG